MVIEHRDEWIQARKKLIFEIGKTSKSIRELYGTIQINLNGKLQSIDINYPEAIQNIQLWAEEEIDTKSPLRTGFTLSLVHNSANLAEQASMQVDQVVFQAQIETELGGGSAEVADRLTNKRFKSGFRLSDSVWKSDIKTKKRFNKIVSNGIRKGRTLGKTIEKAAKLKVKDAPEKLPVLLKKIEQLGRQATSGLPGSRKRFDSLIAQIRKKLSERKVGEFIRPAKSGLSILGTRRATEAFVSRAERAINQNSIELLKEAVDKFLVKRAEYNSVRAARTMAGRAFTETGQVERKKKPWVIGEKWNLSGSHPRPDECDLRANINLGQGRGVYPPGSAPSDHVNGLCFLTDVIDEKHFERDEPFKPEYDKDWKQKVEGVKTGSPAAKEANNKGRKEDIGKVANEVKTAGIHFQSK